MTNLEIHRYLDFSVFGKGELTLAGVVMLLCWVGILVACIVDTRSAINRDKRFARVQAEKAIEEGTATGDLDEVAKRFSPRINSWGLGELFGKVGWYYGFLIIAAFADLILLFVDVWKLFHLPEVPYFSAGMAMVFIAREALSVWENSPKNDRYNVIKSLRRLKGACSYLMSDEEMKQLRKELNDIGGSGF